MSRRHRNPLRPMTEMNVTNLLDTAFVLLMAFMLVAPSIKHGLELELPTVTAGNLNTEEKTLSVVVQPPQVAGGTDRIFIDDMRVALEELTDKLKAEKTSNPKLSVILEIDKSVRYETVAQIISRAQMAGIESVGFLTEPPEAVSEAETNQEEPPPADAAPPKTAAPKIKKSSTQ